MIEHGSVNTISAKTGVPAYRIRKLINDGVLPSVKSGVKHVVTVQAVENWLLGKTAQPPTEQQSKAAKYE